MKQVFSNCKIISFCLLLIYLFSSCKVQVITITGGDPVTGKLRMVDKQGKTADTIFVDAGQKIKWKIKGDSNKVDHFVTMPLKNIAGGSLLKERPIEKHFSKSFKATTKKSQDLMGVNGENYNINWVDKDGKTSHTYDPRIQLNSISN